MVLELKQRVEALERTVTASPRRYGVLYARANALKAQGAALEAEILSILAAHKGPRAPKAYAVWSEVTREPRPKLRRVQQIIRKIKRSNGGIAHDAPNAAQPRAIT
jgi:hypothetical protein